MRRRILTSTVAVALLAIVLLGLPLAVAGCALSRHTAATRVQGVADNVGRTIDDRVRGRWPVGPEQLRSASDDDVHVVAVLADGRRFERGRRADRSGLTGVYSSPTCSVLVEFSEASLWRSYALVVMIVGLVALLALTLAVGLGLRQARRLVEPLVALAETANRLGSARSATYGVATPGVAIPHFGVEELDRLADTLAGSSHRVATMLAAERRFTSDASHQLRTPLTALMLRLEEIIATRDLDEAHDEATVALAQVERLTGVVEHLLQATRDDRAHSAVPLDVKEVVAAQVREWASAYTARGRAVVVEATEPAAPAMLGGSARDGGGLHALATPGGFAQVVATLLENSLVHGAGRTTVRIRSTGVSVVVEVSDEGTGIAGGLGSSIFDRSVSGRSSTGLGLALARDLAEADGGRLELVREVPAVFALFLSLAPRPRALAR